MTLRMNRILPALALLPVLLAAAACERATLSVPPVQRFITFESAGGTVFASITASDDFSARSDADWCYVEAYPHPNDNLRISVSENMMAEARETTITLALEGVPDEVITIHQFASEAFIKPVTKSIVLNAARDNFELTIQANTLYSYSLPSWISDAIQNEVSIGTSTLYFKVEPLATNQIREDEIVFRSLSNPLIMTRVPVKQTTEVLPVFVDPFDWCTGTATDYGKQGDGIEVPWKDIKDSNGWTCEQVNGNLNCWARAGCLRFSRTGYGAILVSPALTEINGTADVKVSFQAARWCDTKLLPDDNYTFSIMIRGSGTPSVSQIQITNTYDTPEWQAKEGSTFSFTIEGADATTQIVWISSVNPNGIIPSTDGNGDGTFSTIGRLLLDNVKVEYL